MVNLPGVKTTQFGWIKSRLPYEPQPVPPIYQPEVMAQAIVWSADHDCRELWVGPPTVKTIMGEKYMDSGITGSFPRRGGLCGQKTSIPLDPNRPGILWASVAQDRGAHGDHTEFRVLEIGVFRVGIGPRKFMPQRAVRLLGVGPVASSPVIPDILYRESRFAVRSGWIPDYQCRG